jgi:hypothetical protein
VVNSRKQKLLRCQKLFYALSFCGSLEASGTVFVDDRKMGSLSELPQILLSAIN